MSVPILHVAPFLWSGAGRVITDLCLAQARRGPVVLVTTGRHGDLADWPSYRRALAQGGVRHLALDTFHRDAATVWSSAAALATHLSALRPRVIHAHAGMPTGVAALARDIAGRHVPLVAQMYSWGPDRPDWMNAQDLWAFRQADVVVSSAHAYSRLLREGGVPARRLVYLPWGLRLDTLPRRAPRPVDAAAPRLGAIGRIEPRKGQLALVEGFAAFRRRVPGARLDLVGPVADRAYAAALDDAIRRTGVTGAVRVRGRVRDVAAIAAGWDLAVSMSSDEGQGLAVLEAMALGVPVLARPVAGIEDFLRDGTTGWTVRGTAPATVAAAIRRALDDAGRRAAVIDRARRMVEQRYDWTRMLRQFDEIYRRAR